MQFIKKTVSPPLRISVCGDSCCLVWLGRDANPLRLAIFISNEAFEGKLTEYSHVARKTAGCLSASSLELRLRDAS